MFCNPNLLGSLEKLSAGLNTQTRIRFSWKRTLSQLLKVLTKTLETYLNLIIITNVQNLLSTFSQVISLAFVKQSATRAAHTVAKQSITNVGCSEWFNNIHPSYLCNVLFSDLIN